DLPDVDISDKGVKITPLDNSVPSAASPFGDLVYGMLPHPKRGPLGKRNLWSLPFLQHRF
ncbi:hypothetical protein, partial [Enterobacter hormaechei]